MLTFEWDPQKAESNIENTVFLLRKQVRYFEILYL